MNTIISLLRETRKVSHGSFNQVFEEMISDYPTYRAAYEALEIDYERANGERRYTDYNSFRQQRYKRFAKRKKRGKRGG